MTINQPRPPMAVRVPLEGSAHLAYARDGQPVDTMSLCGLAVSHDDVMARAKARRLPVCALCDAEDLRRYPDRAWRILRQNWHPAQGG